MNIQHTSLKPESNDFKLNTGLSDNYRKSMSDTLSKLLASSYNLTIKSQVYHWNVVGPLFKPIHELTEEHYTDLFAAIDVIAERIRALGHLTPMHQTLIADMASDEDAGGEVTPETMIKDLVSSHEKIVTQMRDATGSAGEVSDVVTEDMLTERLNFHEQAIWMLRSILAN
jgi:starvation-inducible DNA-binding protein